jgi:hypothetical protein
LIVFAPRYDPATEGNLAVALRILPEGCRALLSEEATRAGLLESLTAAGAPLLCMSHGRPDQLLGQHGETALSGMDAPVLGQRPVFAFACHTASELGEIASREGTFWWGYTGRVTAPDSTEAVLPLFVEIFAYIRDAFPGADSAASCGDVLTRISELCHEAEVRVDDLLDTGTTLDVGSIYLCLLQLWQRLRVWLPGGMEPLLHPEAPPPALLI